MPRVNRPDPADEENRIVVALLAGLATVLVVTLSVFLSRVLP